MKRSLLLGLGVSCLFATVAVAQNPNYGYMRVKIHSSLNLDHRYEAYLTANGHRIGGPFQHDNHERPASEPYPWAALTVQHLNSQANSTPITADYTFGSKCQFLFVVEFSMDANTPIHSSVPFSAPFASSVGSIPIGTNCEGRMRVCSSNPDLQSKLERAHKQALITNYKREKAEIDRRLRARKARHDQQASRIVAPLQGAPLPDFERGRQVLQEHIDRWQRELEAVQEQARSRSDGSTADAGDSNVRPADVAREAARSAEQQFGPSPQALEALQKAADMSIPGFYRNINMLVEEDKAVLNELQSRGEATPADIRDSRNFAQNVEFMQRGLLRGEAFAHVAGRLVKAGAELAPTSKALSFLSSALDFCDIAQGRELCWGRKLTEQERLEKACKAVAKMSLKRVRSLVLGPDPDDLDRFLVQQLETKGASEGCAGVLR